jgi:hypothetical protein
VSEQRRKRSDLQIDVPLLLFSKNDQKTSLRQDADFSRLKENVDLSEVFRLRKQMEQIL